MSFTTGLTCLLMLFDLTARRQLPLHAAKIVYELKQYIPSVQPLFHVQHWVLHESTKVIH